MTDLDWAGRGFTSKAQKVLASLAPAEIGAQILMGTRRVRKVQVPRLPLWGVAQGPTALVLWPGERHAVIHFYGPDGCYLSSSAVRSGEVAIVIESARYWRAEPIPQTFDEVLAGIR